MIHSERLQFGMLTAAVLMIVASVFVGLQFHMRWNIGVGCEHYPSTKIANYGFPAPAMRWQIDVDERATPCRVQLISAEPLAIAMNFLTLGALLMLAGGTIENVCRRTPCR